MTYWTSIIRQTGYIPIKRCGALMSNNRITVSNIRWAELKLKWSYISRLFGSSSGNIWVPLIQQRKLENASKLSLSGRFLLNLSKQCIPPVFLPVDPIKIIKGLKNVKIFAMWLKKNHVEQIWWYIRHAYRPTRLKRSKQMRGRGMLLSIYIVIGTVCRQSLLCPFLS